MKKTFFKVVAATIFATAAISISSVAAMADTRVYNMGEEKSIAQWDKYNTSKSPTAINSTDVTLEFPTTGNTIKVLKNGNSCTSGAIDYTDEATFLKTATSEGDLKGKVLNKAILSTNSASKEKDFISISNIKVGDTIQLYYVGASDSKGKLATSASKMVIKDSEGNSKELAGTNDATTPAYGIFTATAEGDCTIYVSSGRMGILAIVVSDASGEITTYDWNLVKDGLTLDGELKLESETSVNEVSNKLTYDGDDYILKDEYKTLTEKTEGVDVEGTTVTVTPTMDWFEKIVKAEIITDKATFKLEGSEELISGKETTLCTYFSVLPGATVYTVDGKIEGFASYNTAINSGGSALKKDNIPTNRSIKFTISAPGTVQVMAASNDTSEARTYDIIYEDGTKLTSEPISVKQAAVSSVIALDKAGTYYITPNKSINIFSINVVVGGKLSDNASGGKIYSDGSTSYLVASVSDDDVTSKETIAITAEGQTSEEDNVVYSGAVIDGNYITAADLSADFIYVVKANKADVTAFDTVLN